MGLSLYGPLSEAQALASVCGASPRPWPTCLGLADLHAGGAPSSVDVVRVKGMLRPAARTA